MPTEAPHRSHSAASGTLATWSPPIRPTFAFVSQRMEDLPALRDVFRRSSLSNEGDRASLLAHPDALEFSDRAVADGRVRVAVIDDRIVGFATVLVTGQIGELEDLFVDPDWMRRGIATALVLDALANCEKARGSAHRGDRERTRARLLRERRLRLGRNQPDTVRPRTPNARRRRTVTQRRDSPGRSELDPSLLTKESTTRIRSVSLPNRVLSWAPRANRERDDGLAAAYSRPDRRSPRSCRGWRRRVASHR